VGSTYVPGGGAPPSLPVVAKSVPAKPACRVHRVRGLTVRRAKRKMSRAHCRYRVRGSGRIVSSRPRAGAKTRSIVQLRAKRKHRAR
jgi:hypothetical protein